MYPGIHAAIGLFFAPFPAPVAASICMLAFFSQVLPTSLGHGSWKVWELYICFFEIHWGTESLPLSCSAPSLETPEKDSRWPGSGYVPFLGSKFTHKEIQDFDWPCLGQIDTHMARGARSVTEKTKPQKSKRINNGSGYFHPWSSPYAVVCCFCSPEGFILEGILFRNTQRSHSLTFFNILIVNWLGILGKLQK